MPHTVARGLTPIRVVVALAALGLAAPAAQASHLGDHVWADVMGTGNSIYFDPLAVSDPTHAATGLYEGGVGTTRTASAEAAASLDAATLLRVRTASAAPPATSQFDDRFASAIAMAQWRDILFASGAAPPPAVQLNFSVHGTLAVTNVAASSVSFRPNVSRAGFSAVGSQTLSFGGLGSSVVDSGPPSEFVPAVKVESNSDSGFSAAASSMWTSSSLTPDGTGLVWDFNGSFEFVTDLFSATRLGTADPGYLILIGASAGTSMRGSMGSSDFSGTVSLDSITLPGGAPLPADVAFSFDSGLPAVPEPAAPALLGLALAALSRLRRRLV